MLIFTGLGQDFTHFAHKENMHSEIILLGRLKIVLSSAGFIVAQKVAV